METNLTNIVNLRLSFCERWKIPVKGKWKKENREGNVFLGVKNVWKGSKIGVKILEISAPYLINVAEINAQQN